MLSMYMYPHLRNKQTNTLHYQCFSNNTLTPLKNGIIYLIIWKKNHYFSYSRHIYNKTKHSYISSLQPAKQLDRMSWHFLGNQGVAWGLHRLKEIDFFSIFFFSSLFYFFSTGNAEQLSLRINSENC